MEAVTVTGNLVPRVLFPGFGGGAGKGPGIGRSIRHFDWLMIGFPAPPPKPGKSALGTRLSNRVITFVDLASKRIYIFINRAYLYTTAIHLFAASREMVTLQNFIHSNSKVRTTLYSIYIINRTTGKNYPVAFEWLHHRIPSTDSKVRYTLYSILKERTAQ